MKTLSDFMTEAYGYRGRTTPGQYMPRSSRPYSRSREAEMNAGVENEKTPEYSKRPHAIHFFSGVKSKEEAHPAMKHYPNANRGQGAYGVPIHKERNTGAEYPTKDHIAALEKTHGSSKRYEMK
jgi:hypothetical protein